jgi:hypothetical protein
MRRVAFISDIHGNAVALEAVLAKTFSRSSEASSLGHRSALPAESKPLSTS